MAKTHAPIAEGLGDSIQGTRSHMPLLSEAGAPPGEQPCASPDLIRPEAVIHVSVNRLGLSRGCMLSCC